MFEQEVIAIQMNILFVHYPSPGVCESVWSAETYLQWSKKWLTIHICSAWVHRWEVGVRHTGPDSRWMASK